MRKIIINDKIIDVCPPVELLSDSPQNAGKAYGREKYVILKYQGHTITFQDVRWAYATNLTASSLPKEYRPHISLPHEITLIIISSDTKTKHKQPTKKKMLIR